MDPHSRRINDWMDASTGSFVGRDILLSQFRTALASDGLPLAVLYVHGPGGIGKTALLREYERLAAVEGRPVHRLDARHIEVSPAGFLAALRHAVGSSEDGAFDAARECPARGVLLLDTCEMISPLYGWLRDTFLPELPDGSLVVIADRNSPASEWQADLAWAALTRVIALRPLSADESLLYLAARGIPAAQATRIQSLAHGHPLALALIADLVRIGALKEPFSLVQQPNTVRELLGRLLGRVPGAAHRRALAIAAIARTTTEPLLTQVLGPEDGPVCFAWLRELTVIEHGEYGIFPHDTVRELLDADWRWRDARSYAQSEDLVLAWLRGSFARAAGSELSRLRQEIMFVRRHDPGMKPYFAWEEIGQAYAEPAAGTEDVRAILEMVKRHQGEASADVARYWLARQPTAFRIFRTRHGALCGCMANLELDAFHAEDATADPAIAAARAFTAAHGPLEADEGFIYLRFWMDRDGQQIPSPAVNLTAADSVSRWLTHPRLAWNFIAIADPEFWHPHFTSIRIPRHPGADFELGGRRFGVFAHDWRIETAVEWERRRRCPGSPDRPASRSDGREVALPRHEFAAAVREALKDYTRPTLLVSNRVLATPFAADAAALKARLEEAARSLEANPKDLKLYRAVWHTYFEPAPKQELVAEMLNLPFSTYRYRLTNGVERIVAALWHEYASHLTKN